MENLNSPEKAELPQAGYVPSEVLDLGQTTEAQKLPTIEQVDLIISDAKNMVGELPTTVHTEQDRFDKVDIEEAILPDVTVRHIHGKDGDVTIIEPSLLEKSAQIVIDNNTSEIFIDGEPVDEAGANKVADVIKITRNINAETVNSSSELDREQDESGQAVRGDELQETMLEDRPATIDIAVNEEAVKQQKRQVLGQVGQFLKTRNGDMAFKQIAAEIGVDPKELQEKMSRGEINVGPDTMRALNELGRNAAKPNSDIWGTDPRTNSMLGGAARESQQLLSGVLKNMF